MKFVKKLLRLLPFLMLLIIGVYAILFQNTWTNLTQYDSSLFVLKQPFNYINNLIVNFVNGFSTSQNFNFFTTFINSISYFFTGKSFPIALQTNEFVLICYVIFVFCYELWLSMLFLIFDLFNWFLSLGRNLLKKGGKFDD